MGKKHYQGFPVALLIPLMDSVYYGPMGGSDISKLVLLAKSNWICVTFTY
jgi:hypothetical protein